MAIPRHLNQSIFYQRILGQRLFFEKAKEHITELLGEPKLVEDVKQGDIALEWKVKAVRISLNLFYKDRKKVHLEIGWWL